MSKLESASRGAVRLSRRALGTLAAVLALSAGAQESAPDAFESAPTHVLQVERLDGVARVQRGGRETALQTGYLIFSEEHVVTDPGTRLGMRLARLGSLELVANTGKATLVVDKLPFSSWAVELDTRLRLEQGVLRVDWTRADAAERWPLVLELGHWNARLGRGEFLLRRDEGDAEICAVSGSAELADDTGRRQRINKSRCLRLSGERDARVTDLVLENWPQTGAGPQAESAAPDLGAVQTAAGDPQVPVGGGAKRVWSSAGAAMVPPEALAPPRVVVLSSPGVALNPPSPVGAPAAPAAAATVAAPEPAVPARPAVSSPGTVPATPASQASHVAPAAPVAAPASGAATATVPTPTAPETVPVQPAAPTSEGSNPASAESAPAPETAGPEWIINVLTLTDPAAADQHVRRLTEAGYPAELRAETVRGRSSYRVVIAKVNSEQAADRIVQLLGAKMGYPSAWAMQKR